MAPEFRSELEGDGIGRRGRPRAGGRLATGTGGEVERGKSEQEVLTGKRGIARGTGARVGGGAGKGRAGDGEKERGLLVANGGEAVRGSEDGGCGNGEVHRNGSLREVGGSVLRRMRRRWLGDGGVRKGIDGRVQWWRRLRRWWHDGMWRRR